MSNVNINIPKPVIDYDDLTNKPTLVTKHSQLTLDDGTNPHGTTKSDVGLGDVPNLDTTNAVNKAHDAVTLTGTLNYLTIVGQAITRGLIDLANHVTGRLSFNNLPTGTARSVVGRSGSGNGDLGNISAGNNTILGRSGSGNVQFNSASETKQMLSLQNVDNTSDANKPISNATQTALDAKQNLLTNPVTGTGTNGQVSFWTGTNAQSGDNGLFWNNTNKRLGVGGGASAPQNTLQVYGTNQTFALRVGQNTSNTDNSWTGISFFNSTTVGGGNTGTGQANIKVYRFSGGLGGEMEFNLGSTPILRIVRAGNVVIGSTTAGARLDVRAQGALSTDIAFRVRNSADTANHLTVRGNGTINMANLPTSSAGLVAGDLWNNGGVLNIV